MPLPAWALAYIPAYQLDGYESAADYLWEVIQTYRLGDGIHQLGMY
jgi:hypothetical protein